MPRKRQRFSRLKSFLKASAGAPTGEAAKYLDYISGKTKLQMKNALGSGNRDRALVSLKVFNKLSTNRYGAFITRYVYKQQSAVGLPQTDTGQEAYDPTNKTNPSVYDGAYNAAIIIFRSNAVGSNTIAAETGKTSQITGKKYNSAGGRSGVVPFGKKDDTDMEDDRAKLLQAQVKSTPGGLGATYQPEEWNAPFIPKDASKAFT